MTYDCIVLYFFMEHFENLRVNITPERIYMKEKCGLKKHKHFFFVYLYIYVYYTYTYTYIIHIYKNFVIKLYICNRNYSYVYITDGEAIIIEYSRRIHLRI